MKKLLSLFIVFALVISNVTVFASSASNTANADTATAKTTTVAETKTITFSDVDANTSSGAAVYKLVNAGILNGYADGTFRPNNPITRAELCKVVNLAFKYTDESTDTFSDVKSSDWFYSYVAIAKKAGYITGHADGTFKGNNYLTTYKHLICARLSDLLHWPHRSLDLPAPIGFTEYTRIFLRSKIIAAYFCFFA